MKVKNFYSTNYCLLFILYFFTCLELKAQVTQLDGDLGNLSFSSHALSIPKEFSFDNTPSLILRNRGNNNSYNIYNEDLELVRTVDVSNWRNSFDYQLTYQREEREVTNVSIKNEREESMNMSLEDFINREKMMNPNLTDDDFVITNSDNGDIIITLKSNVIPEYDRPRYFAYYDVYGEKYPKIYFRCRDGVISRIITSYTIEYSEWQAKDTYKEDRQESCKPIRLMNVDLNSGETYFVAYFYLSQTLFNNDEEFEYIMPKYVLTKGDDNNYANPVDSQYENDDDRMVLTRSTLLTENAQVAVSGFQVFASNSTLIKDIDFDEGPLSKSDLEDKAYVISIGDKRYLAFGNSSKTYFYSISSETSDIRKARSLPASFSVSPTVVDKNTNISINLGDNNENGSNISLFSPSGKQMEIVYVPAGETQVQMNVKTTPGVYLVSRVSGGKDITTKKIVVK